MSPAEPTRPSTKQANAVARLARNPHRRTPPNRPRSSSGTPPRCSRSALPHCSLSAHSPFAHTAQPLTFLVRHPARCPHSVRDSSARPVQPPAFLVWPLPRCPYSAHSPSVHPARLLTQRSRSPSARAAQAPMFLISRPAQRTQPLRPPHPSACVSRQAPLPRCSRSTRTNSYPALHPTLR